MLNTQTLLAGVGGSLGVLYVIHWFLANKRRTRIKGKVALITGANSGLGKACAYTFYKAGCNVILAGRNQQQLYQVQNELQETMPQAKNGIAVLQIDLSNIEQIESKGSEAIGFFGGVDILVNNAGISYRGTVEDTEMDVHVKVMTVNYFGQIALTKALLPYMLERGGGHIVAVSSVQGRISQPFRSAYAASKHALQAYFDSLRAEMAGKNMNVCVVSPGYIQTNLSQNAVCADGSNYGVCDKNSASGVPPEKMAITILQAVERHTWEVIPAPLLHRFVIILRSLWPNLYFWIMAKRGKKQRIEYDKYS